VIRRGKPADISRTKGADLEMLSSLRLRIPAVRNPCGVCAIFFGGGIFSGSDFPWNPSALPGKFKKKTNTRSANPPGILHRAGGWNQHFRKTTLEFLHYIGNPKHDPPTVSSNNTTPNPRP